MESFPTQSMLESHFQEEAGRGSYGHTNFRINKCLRCNSYFSPYECQECKESFKTRGKLRKHKDKNKNHHPNWKSFNCGNCNERAIKLQKHQKRCKQGKH